MSGGVKRLTMRITVDLGAGDRDLYIEVPVAATGSDLYRLLGNPASGVGLNQVPPLLVNQRTGRALQHDEPLVEADVVTGDRLAPVIGSADEQPLTWQFLTGPRQGHRDAVPVIDHGDPESPLVIGRRLDPGFDHPSVSRRHAMLEFIAGGPTIRDLGSTNGTTVNGQPLEPTAGRPTEIHPGDVVELGDVGFTVTALPPGRRPLGPPFAPAGGHLAFQPAPRAADPPPPSRIELPEPPSQPTKRRFPLGAALLPLILGAMMAMIFSPIFALFMAMSPLMVVWTYVDDRRSGRRTYATERHTFLADLAAARLRINDAADELAAWHRRRTPALDQIVRWVRCGAPDLWSRRPAHDDFLMVTAGRADRPSALSVVVPERGAPELVAEAVTVAEEVAVEGAGPVVIDLAATPIVGITGGGGAVAVARSLVMQLVGLRSPKDLELAILAPEQSDHWSWTKWLPHVVDPTGDDPHSGRRMVAADDEEALTLLSDLTARAERRVAVAGDRIGGGRSEHLGPHIVVVIHPPVGLSPAAVARLLGTASTAGLSVLFVTPDSRGLPAEAVVHIEVASETADVHYLTEGATVGDVDLNVADSEQATALARDLAPLIDVTVTRPGGGIPAAVSLPAVRQSEGGEYSAGSLFDVEATGRRWAADPSGLVATVGADGNGPVAIDLQADGPHGLVAGTTGSGKSELLQTMVADLAAHHGPGDLNFILIDYKGGSAFRECRHLPHTVGFVTDLDDHLAARALISLRAELRHRERVLAEFDVSDLAAMRARYRHSVNSDQVPPSLVIVVDEFAALRSEVPEFVDGLVDVAQRGRSMGVHMILATQKPGGVITPQIDANTNIRVALRVASDGDSRDLIGVADAARIPTERPGRAVLKIGGAPALTPFQAAFVGGRSTVGGAAERCGVAEFGYGMRLGPFRPVDLERGDDGGRPADSDDRSPAWAEATDLGRIVETCRVAWQSAASTRPRELRRPWLPPLPAAVSLTELPTPVPRAVDDGPLPVAIGLADLPDAQAQVRYGIDFGQAGNVAVFGTAGSGKTTLLRTLACSLSTTSAAEPGPPVIYGIDFGAGLEAISALPTVADVVAGSDPERLQLLLAMLEAEVDQRLEANKSQPGHRMIVLIDGFGSFWDTLESFDLGRQADRFSRLLSRAPSAGVHMVMTADQRSALPFSCLGSVGLRLLQRLASVDEYRSLGLNSAPDPQRMTPGRTLVVDGPEMQVALVGDGSVAAIAEVAADLQARGMTRQGRPVRALADIVAADELTAPRQLSAVAIGLDPTHAEVALDLVGLPTLLVAGAPGSGRSTVLLTLGHQLSSLIADRRAIAPKRTSPVASPAARPGGGEDRERPYPVLVGADVDSLSALAAEVEQRATVGYQEPMVVAVDDADLFFDNNQASSALTTLVLKGRDAGVVVLMAASSFRAGTAYETWIRAMRSNGHGLVLQPDGDKEEDLFDVRFPRGSALRFPPGRGYLVVRSTVRVVQVAAADLPLL